MMHLYLNNPQAAQILLSNVLILVVMDDALVHFLTALQKE